MRDIVKKVKIGALASNENSRTEKRLIVSLFALAIILATCYGYFVQQTITNIVRVESIVEEMNDLGSEVSSLEEKYIELKNKVDLNFAYQSGYKEVGSVKFVSRNTLGRSLTLREN